MIAIAAVIALLIFIYFTRYINNKREERRANRQERRQEIFDRTLEQVRKGDADKPAEDKMED